MKRGLVEAGGGSEKVSSLTGLNRAVGAQELYVDTLVNKAALLLVLKIVLTGELSEAPVTGDDNLLTSRELELGTTECLLSRCGVSISAADGHEHLANGDTSAKAKRLSESATHTSLQSIGACA